MANSRWGPLILALSWLLVFILVGGCNPDNRWSDGDADGDVDGDADSDGDGDSLPPVDDADGDGISDLNEGRPEEIDTDGDGTPDYLDDDSDGDTIPDFVESGTNGDATRPPRDSDDDGTPDFRDVDSDANGVFDRSEGGGDADGDGIPDSADWDNDGDTINDVDELGDPSSPVDSDGDGIPDYYDIDSDGDLIHDMHESNVDTDRDGTPDYLDLDTDNDGISDRDEAGDDDVNSPPLNSDDDLIPDFRDPDSDNDGLSDADEAASGTDPTATDSDADGVSDLVEVSAGTDPLNPEDNPRTRGDFVFLVPYEEPPSPERDTLSFSTDIQIADVYFLMDTTGSMGGAIGGLQRTLTGTIIPGIAATIPDVFFGVGHFDDYPAGSYGSGGDVAYRNLLHMTDDGDEAQRQVNTLRAWGGADGPESHVPALYSVATGCTVPGDRFITADPACADDTLVGYPHFRPGAVPIIVLFSDALFHNGPGNTSPYSDAVLGFTAATYDQAVAALADIHARVIGVSSSSYGRGDMERLVRDTGTVDAGGAPFIYNQSDADFGNLVVDAVAAVSHGIPLDIAARGVDDETDEVDATIFIESIIPAPDAGDPCTPGLMVDGATFRDVMPGSTVCFEIIPAQNNTVEPTTEPQIFIAAVQVWGDDVTLLDERDIYFLVPPEIEDPGGPD